MSNRDVAAISTNGESPDVVSSNEVADQPTSSPIPQPTLTPRRVVDLQTIALAAAAEARPVESLVVREFKGIGDTFTPNFEQQLTFHGLAYRPEGEFDTTFQLLAGKLLADPRVALRAKQLTFVPAFHWPTQEVVLAPFKRTRFGARVLADLEVLSPGFPNFKAFVEWNDSKRRHIVREISLMDHERERIAAVKWPTRDQVIEALQIVAYDDLDDLAAANDEIRLLLTSREVG